MKPNFDSMDVSFLIQARHALLLVMLMVFTGVVHADKVFVWNTNGTIVKLATNGVGTVFATNLSGWNGPVGLTVDNDGNLLAGCPANSGIWKFATNGSIEQIGNVDSISGLAFDSEGTLYGTIPN